VASVRWPLLLTEELLPPGEECACVSESAAWQFVLVRHGVIYWLGQPAPRELQPGELLVCGPGSEGVLRASQVNEVRLRCFGFDPAALVGVLTLGERVELRRRCGALEVFPAEHPAARLVAQAPLPETMEQTLVSRAELLHAALLVVAGRLSAVGHQQPPVASAEHRLRNLLTRAPDGALLSRSPAELAALCGCSVRHLNRLVRGELACSWRAAQQEARLRQARELIEQSGARVADIARAVGYGHLGQFNAAFKRLFGLTPSQCRKACFRIVTDASSFRHDPATK
jgi:AraC-like DNA-binding protein